MLDLGAILKKKIIAWLQVACSLVLKKKHKTYQTFKVLWQRVYSGGQTTEADSGPAGMWGRDGFMMIERQRLERGFSRYREHHKILQERAKLYGLFWEIQDVQYHWSIRQRKGEYSHGGKRDVENNPERREKGDCRIEVAVGSRDSLYQVPWQWRGHGQWSGHGVGVDPFKGHTADGMRVWD